MSTFALIHGGGGTSWDWHLVSSGLRQQGHDPVAVGVALVVAVVPDALARLGGSRV